MNPIVENELLRQHVTRVGFDLNLGKTHVAALVFIETAIREKRWIDSRGPVFRLVIPGLHGLEDRGLVVHHYDSRYGSKGKWRDRDHPGRHYTVTRAGRLVRDLLKEAGIWQEYEAAMPQRPSLG